MVRRLARVLLMLRVEPDMILTSPCVRAARTAQLLGKAMGLKQQIVYEPQLAPGFALPELRSLLDSHGDANAMLLVGHDPDFGLVIGEVCGGGRVMLKKAGLAQVDVDPAKVLAGVLSWLTPPDYLIEW